MKKLWVGVAFFVVAVMGGCGGSNGVVPSSGSREVIVFQRNNAINAMTPDESNMRFVTNGYGPALSPDGRKIAFFMTPGSEPDSQIFTCGIDGSERKQITTSGGFTPSWSPDGKQIVYCGLNRNSGDGNDSGLLLINADGNGNRRLTSNRFDEHPQFRPGRQSISFSRYEYSETGSYKIYSINLDGSDEKFLVNGGQSGHDWSSDGSSLTYINGQGGQNGASFDAFFKRFDGSSVVKLTEHGNVRSKPSFSPDDRKIVYSDNTGSSVIIGPGGPSVSVSNLYVLNLATKEVKKITNDGRSENPDWGYF